MSTLITYWRGSTRRRLLQGLAGIAACLAPLIWLAVNPSAAVRVIEWGLSRKRSNRHATTAAEPHSSTAGSAATVTASGSPPATTASHDPQSPAPESSALLQSAIAASIGVPRLAQPTSQAGQATSATGNPAADAQNIELLQRVCNLLKSGRERFAQFPAYSATFFKRERIGSELSGPTTLELKVRHQPFAVYLKWVEGYGVGKEVLYREGENDGSMLVRLGGVKGRLIPALKLDPAGPLAMSESRYPVTKAGIAGLADSLISHREQELSSQVYAHARQEPDAEVDGRRCAVYFFEFDDRERSPDYRKSVQFLDRQWNVPLLVENYGWPEPGQHPEGAALDESTLIEYYKYSNVVVDGRLTDDDFSPSNPEYRFRR